MANKTAIEWLYYEIKHIIPNDFLDKFEEAKQKEKEQIIEAFDQGDYLHDVWTVTGDDYYNETYLENKTNDK